MSEVCQDEAANIEETNVIAPKKVRKYDPISLFSNNTKAARFWFFVCIGLFLFILIQPSLILEKMKIKERIIIMDESGTFHVSPIQNFEEAVPMHDYVLSVATQALLNRGPKNVDNEELLKQMFLQNAYLEAADYLKEEAGQFMKKKLHQKVEIDDLQITSTTSKTVVGNVRGQLIRIGTFEGKKFTDTKEFSLKLKLVRNPNLTANGRLPLAVLQWKIKTRDYVERVETKSNSEGKVAPTTVEAKDEAEK